MYVDPDYSASLQKWVAACGPDTDGQVGGEGVGVFESISVLSLRSQAKRVKNVGEEVLRSEELKM